jgi:PAS domain S-box-containing protein
MSKQDKIPALSPLPQNPQVIDRTSILPEGTRHIESDFPDSAIVFSEIINAARDAIIAIDTQGEICLWNDGAQNLFGWKAEEVIGKNVHSVLAPLRFQKMASTALERFRQTGEGNAINSIQNLSARHKSGQQFAIELSLSPLPMGESWGAVGIARDISSRQKMEEELRQSEKKFRTVFENSLDSISVNRFSDGACVLINEEFSKMTGFTTEEVYGRDSLDTQVWQNPEEREIYLERLGEEGKVQNMPATFRMKNGTIRHGIISGFLIAHQGEQHIISMIKDVSEQKKSADERELLQQKLFQAQKMEAIGTMAGGIGHDFNNILSVILATADMMAQEEAPGSSKHNDLKDIITATQKATELTRSLLTFSRQQVLEVYTVNMNSIIQDFLKSIKRIVGEDVEVIQNLSAELWNVNVDPNQITNIIANLVTNARHAMPNGGTIILDTKNVEITPSNLPKCLYATTGDFVRFSVEDTGTGIPEEHLPRIFDPFFTTKPIGEGTGLGLAMIFGSVRQQNGFIEVETQPGKGTTFHIYFPAVDKIADDASLKLHTEKPQPGNETILVVEDDPQTRNAIVRMLKRCNYNVIDAGNAGIAFLKLKKMHEESKTVDLVLTDVRMPEMSGPEMAQNLRQEYPGLKFMFMSGHPYHADDLEGEQFLAKPFNTSHLTAKIRRIFDQKK